MADDNIGGMGKPPTFDGSEEHWAEWSFIMRAYLPMVAPEAATIIEAAELPTELASCPMLDNTRIAAALGDEGVKASKRIYYAIVMACKGPALTTIRAVPAPEGGECWRALCRRYEPRTAPRLHSLMTGILNVKPFSNELATFETQLGEWETLIRKWESQSGEALNDSMKRAVFLERAPAKVRQLLQL